MAKSTAVASMTGFARAEGGHGGATWQWEVRSVNGRGLEVRAKLATGLDRLEPQVRERTAAAVARGSVSISLRVTRPGEARAVSVNRELVRALRSVAAELGETVSLDAVFAVPGVVEVSDPTEDEAERETLDAAMLADLDRALGDLKISRRAEGGRIGAILSGLLDEIAAITKAAAGNASAQPDLLRAKFTQRVAEMLADTPPLAPDRLAQEVALLALKADVREEIDRLGAHIAAGRELLAEGGPVGRKLDFLTQELAREANTLCSKSADADLTRAGLALKVAIERFREQVQNLE